MFSGESQLKARKKPQKTAGLGQNLRKYLFCGVLAVTFYLRSAISPSMNLPVRLSSAQFSFNFSRGRFRGQTMSDEIMTIREVADFLKIKEKTAYRLVAEGRLPGFKVGGAWRFKRSDLEVWIDRQKDEQGG
jgi:excisionase family DNA binding protein